MAAVGWVWGTTLVVLMEPAQQHYPPTTRARRRACTAIRHLFNKMLGQLYHCLHQTYDPVKAFGYPDIVARESGAA